jgi:hypothetical protein
MFVLGVLSFDEAKPRNLSTAAYHEKDEFKGRPLPGGAWRENVRFGAIGDEFGHWRARVHGPAARRARLLSNSQTLTAHGETVSFVSNSTGAALERCLKSRQCRPAGVKRDLMTPLSCCGS